MKFKNFCPIRVGDILFTSLTSNPATTYLGTTWEELPQNKFIKTCATPLQQSGSNNIKLTKANLPTDKLQIDSHSHTRGGMNITGKWTAGKLCDTAPVTSGALYNAGGNTNMVERGFWGSDFGIGLDASRSWTGSTSSASPYTTAMGSGTPLTINPEHITVKAWKRLT